MIKVATKGAQRVKNSIRRAIEKRRVQSHLTVGIHEDAGEHSDGISNAQLGAALHFGTDKIPPRPWLDIGVGQGTKKYSEAVKMSLQNGRTYEQALETVGALAAAEAQVFMTDLQSPPNAPSTIKQKGSSNPLIDKGQLRQSVTYKVEPGKA